MFKWSALLVLGFGAASLGVAFGLEGSTSTDLVMFSPASGKWHILHPDRTSDSFFYGNPGDLPLIGDWDCDGEDTVGMFRPSNGFAYLRNSNTFGVADIDFFYGIPGDIPLVGDWDGDGCDTLAIYRGNEVFVSNRLGTHPADFSFMFGVRGDRPFSGDFDGDGIDTIGLYREATGLVYFRNELSTGFADYQFYYGVPSDRIVAGDWDDDGDDTVGIFRPSQEMFFLSNENRQGPADLELEFGDTAWIPPTGPLPPVAVTIPPPPTTTTSSTTSTTLPPAYDVELRPGDDFQAAVDANPPGTRFYVRAGTHRFQQVVPKDGQSFDGEPGAVMTGARVLEGWTFDGQWWSVGGQTQQGPVHGICEPPEAGQPEYPRCAHPEDLFVDNVTFRHVASIADLGPGTWYFDYDADRIYLGENPAGRLVETSVSMSAFSGSSDGVVIRDLVIEKYAIPAQQAAVDSRSGAGTVWGSNWVVDNVEARFNHGAGIHVTNGGVISNSYVHHNGQQGICAQGANVRIESNTIAFNNTARFWLDWEGGGTKFSSTTDLVVRGNHVHDNYGPGIWTDVFGSNATIEDNLVEHNYRSGIMVEITYGATVRNNHTEANGLDDIRGTVWLWSSGILVAASSDVEVYGNTVVFNANGITAVQQDRGNGPDGQPLLVRNLSVHDNDIWMNRGATGGAEDYGDPAFYTSRNNWFENNTYHSDPAAARFAWNGVYNTFEVWQSIGHDDTGSITAP